MIARAVVHRAPWEVAVEEFELRPPGPGEALIRVRHSLISPGSELRCLAGQQPDAIPFPYIPGYAMAGEVIECGPDADLAQGDRVYLNGTTDGGALSLMWGGHASHAIAPASACIRLPDGVSTLEAGLTHLAAIAYHGCRLASPTGAERVAVIGLGVLGQLCARMYELAGCRVVACDVSERRVALARSLGVVAQVVSGSIPAALARLMPEGADIVVDVTGNPAVIPEGVAAVRDVPWTDEPGPAPRYVVQGSYAGEFTVPYQQAFMKELRFLLPRDCTPSDRF
ncbi:MAG: zinc-binding dehydrogenase, partial [Armatimonadetes bacterium]|nr:zinc-binding dehydrogenase [Armatimonadota bacterium]